MATVKSVTAQFLSQYESRFSRYRYRKDIQLWRRFCDETGRHPLDGSVDSGQAFWHWMEAQFPLMSCKSRFSGVLQWFDALVEGRIIKGHGLRTVKKTPGKYKPKRPPRKLDDAELDVLLAWFRRKGPKYEWFVAMVAYCSLTPAEVLAVRKSDVRYWDGRCLLTVRNRKGWRREIPLTGRLEMLTVGLGEVFGPTVPLCGFQTAEHMIDLLKKASTEVLDKSVTFFELRRNAVIRQSDRGVPPAVLAKWLGHRTDKWVRITCRIDGDVWATTPEQVFEHVDVSMDSRSYGSRGGYEPTDALLQDFAPTPDDGHAEQA